jgi:5-methylcytosine-specific restriction endonuclease McrA
LLAAGQAAVFRHAPFTIILKSEEPEALRPLRLKIDPGSKVTGLALIEEHSHRVVFAAELRHRGQAVRDALLHRRALRRSRRSRKTRHRAPRFLNRRRRSGWLPPSLESRIANVMTWVRRLRRLTPVHALSVESVKFDTQLLEHPDIHGVEYQQGTLQGYDVKEYLLEKWGRHCAYCGKGGQPLQIEHIVPKIRGGSDRVGNLALACRPCNQEKGNRTAAEYGHPEVQRRAKRPLKDAAAINATRRALVARLREDGLPVEQATGGETKYNRTRLGLPKAHWVDAACVGQTGAAVLVPETMALLTIISTGHGTRQMCGTDRYGFPIRYRGHQRTHRGFRTGDLVVAQVPRGKYAGCHRGRVLVRASGRFDIQTPHGRIQGVAARCCRRLQGRDGYEYRNAMTGINDQLSTAFNDRYDPMTLHRRIVGDALAAGLPVPANVLADYPDLSGTEAA